MRSQDGSLPETIVVSMPVADIETTTMPSNGPEKPKKRQDREKAAMRLRKAGWSYRRIAEALAVPYIMIGRWLSGDSPAAAAPTETLSPPAPALPPARPARPPETVREPEPEPEPELEAEPETKTETETETETETVRETPAPENTASADARPVVHRTAPVTRPVTRPAPINEDAEDLGHQVTVLKLQFSAFDKYVQDVISRFEKDRKDLMRRQNAALDKLEAGKAEADAARAKAETDLKDLRAEIEALRAESETFHDEVRQKLKSASGGSGGPGKSGGRRFPDGDDEDDNDNDDDADGDMDGEPKDDTDENADDDDDGDKDDFKFDLPDMDDEDDEPPKTKGGKRRSPF